MKIQDLFPKITESSNNTRQSKEQGEKVTKSFANILQETASSPSKDACPVVSGAPLIDTSNLTPAQDAALTVGHQTLDLLNHYESLLTNMNFSQDGMKPLSHALATQSDQLGNLRNELDKDDPLRDTIERIRVLSMVESIKLDRGDYNS